MTTWLQHVKAVYAKGGKSYKEAMKAAAKTWKKGKAAAPKKGRRKKKEEEPDEKAEEPAKRKRKRKRAPAKGAKTKGMRPGVPQAFKNIN